MMGVGISTGGRGSELVSPDRTLPLRRDSRLGPPEDRERSRDNNPGALCDESYFTQGVSDVTCIFASFEGFNQLSPPAQFWQYNPSRFAALPYQITNAKVMRQVISDAIVKRIGYLYISDAPKGSNPWAQLPVYWDDEVEAVSRAN